MRKFITDILAKANLGVEQNAYVLGTVGIGTASPSYLLHVNGTSYFNGNMGINGEGSGVTVDSGYGNNGRVGFMKYGGYEGMLVAGNATLLRLGHRTDSTLVAGGTPTIREDLTITAAGNVLIGTTTDDGYKLNVSNGSSNVYIRAVTSGSANWATLLLQNGDGSWHVTNDDTGTFNIGTTNDPSTQQKLSITSGGNVGIGTTTPVSALSVVGKTNLGGQASGFYVTSSTLHIASSTVSQISFEDYIVTAAIAIANNTFAFGHQNASPSYEFKYSNTYNGNYATTGTTFARFNPTTSYISSGNVGIGTTSPSTKLHVLAADQAGIKIESVGTARLDIASGGGGAAVINSTQNGIYFQDNGTTRVLFTSAGNVGIGTTSPSDKLDVQGAGGVGIRVSNSSNPAYYSNLILNYNDVSTMQLTCLGTPILTAGNTGNTVLASRTNTDIILSPNGTGNVGINTTEPQRKLDSYTAGGAALGNNYVRFGVGAAGAYGGNNHLEFSYNDYGNLGGRAFDNILAKIEGNTDLVTPTDVGGILVFSTKARGGTYLTAPIERMRITHAGNVGIGITNPAYKLQIYGVQNANDFVITNATTGISLRSQSNDASAYIYTTGNLPLGFGTNNTVNQLIIATTGNVGIGSVLTESYALSDRLRVRGGAIQVMGEDVANVRYRTLISSPLDFRHFYMDVAANTANQVIAYFGKNINGTETDFMTINDGFVGIGTTNPGAELAINSANSNTRIFLQNAASTKLEVGYGPTGYGFTHPTGEFIAHSDNLYFGQITASTNVTFTTTGNVGIGTTSPSQKLEVVGTVFGTTLRAYNATVSGNLLKVSSNGTAGWEFNNTGGGNSSVELSGYNVNTKTISFNPEGNSYINNGNVGIGTTSPLHKLSVSSNQVTNDWGILVQNTNTGGYGVSQFFNLYGYASSPAADFSALQIRADYPGYGRISFVVKEQAQSTALESLVLRGNGQVYMNSGNVGIGTTSPSEKLDVAGTGKFTGTNVNVRAIDGTIITKIQSQTVGGTQGAVGTESNNDLAVVTNNTTRMLVTAAGNVGIGDTSPITRLNLGSYSGSRLPYIDGTGSTFNANGITVTSANSANTAIGGGIDLTNNTYSIGAYSPIVSFSSISSNGSFNAAYAGVWGIVSAQGVDANWIAGHLVFGSGGGAGISERMRITSGGNVLIGTTTDYTSKLVIIPSANPTSSTGANNQISIGEVSNNTAYSLKIGYIFTGGGYQGSIQSIAGGVGSVLFLNASGGNVTIGTTTDSGYKLDVNGSSAFRNDMYVISTSTYWYNGTSYFQATNSSDVGILKMTNNTSPIALQPNGGNVGIGTTTPLSTLNVQKPINTELTLLYSTNLGNNFTQLSGGSTVLPNKWAAIKFLQDSSDDAHHMTFSTASPTVNTTERMRITSAGNVGIGTSSPASSLHINGTGDQSITLQSTTTASSQSSYIKYIRSTTGSSRTWWTGVGIQGGADDSFSFYDQTASAERMRITAAGSVGIGTSSPGAMLDVNGNILTNSTLYAGSIANSRFTVDATTIYAYYSTEPNARVAIGRDVYSGGSAGIALGGQGTFAMIGDGSGATTGNVLAFSVGAGLAGGPAAEKMRITSGGLVGIGTTAPQSKLEVRSSGSGNAGAVITLNRVGAWGSAYSGLKLNTDDAGTDWWNVGMLATTTNTFNIGQNGGAMMSILVNGNIGIGTTSPGYKLDVNGIVFSNNQLKAITPSGGVSGYFTDAVNSTLQIKHASGYLQFLNGSNIAWLKEDGNGAATFSSSVTATKGTFVGTGCVLDLNRTDNTALVQLQYNGTIGSLLGTTGANNFIVYNASASPMLTLSGGAATFSSSVTAAGGRFTSPVTINGSSIPSDRLFEVTGNTSTVFGMVLNPTWTYTGANIYGIYAGNNFNTGTITNSYNLFIEATNIGSATITNKYGIYQSGSSDKNYFAGNVGIGTTSPSEILHVKSPGSNGGVRYVVFLGQNSTGYQNSFVASVQDELTDLGAGIVGTNTGSNLSFSTHPNGGSLTERMRITKTGNVGINTTTPTETLDVNGAVNATGYKVNGAAGYNGTVTILQPTPNPPKTFTIVNGIITNVV